MGYSSSKTTWVNPNIEYLFDYEITEYDMSDAGFNIIKHFNLLPTETIKSLSGLEKHDRHIAIGKIQRNDKNLSKSLLDRFAEMRKLFISANDLQDNDIISVKKDAIFTIKQCSNLSFGKIQFVDKNNYTSYIRFPDNMNIEIYYKSKSVDIKGMGDIAVNRHRLYMLTFIIDSISHLESKDNYMKRYLKDFIERYKRGDLDEEYYVEFNNMSLNYNPEFNYMKIILPILQMTLKEIR